MEERKQHILRAIVQSYIATAEPVGSRTVARIYSLGISPATIRNEMQDLELMGYLEQPHISAGRIPSWKGYRFYVDSLMQPGAVSAEEEEIIREWFAAQRGRAQIVLSDLAKVLSKLTHTLSLAITNEAAAGVFHYVRFLPLNREQAILLVVTQDGLVENSLFPIPGGVRFEELASFAERINNAFHGRPLREVTQEALLALREDLWAEPEVYVGTAERIRDAAGRGREIYTGGVAELIRQPEFHDTERIRELLALTEESERLAELLTTGPETALDIRIGPETGDPVLRDFSVVRAQFFADRKLVGSVAVVGPTRMEYDKIFSLLQFMQARMNVLLSGG